jgi:magnesium chelatase family protein
MFVKTYGSAVYGVEATTITIEVNWTAQGKDYCIVGLPDNAIKESMQRVESAIKSNGFEMPRTRIVVNLAPADLKKSGTAFDLPIAIGVLTASEQIKITKSLSDHIMMGELSLDGELRAIRGALPIAIQAKREGFKGLIIPHMNAREAAMVDEVNVFGMKTLKEVVAFIRQEGNNFTPLKIDVKKEFYD